VWTGSGVLENECLLEAQKRLFSAKLIKAALQVIPAGSNAWHKLDNDTVVRRLPRRKTDSVSQTTLMFETYFSREKAQALQEEVLEDTQAKLTVPLVWRMLK
jgi:hypothetical protein